MASTFLHCSNLSPPGSQLVNELSGPVIPTQYMRLQVENLVFADKPSIAAANGQDAKLKIIDLGMADIYNAEKPCIGTGPMGPGWLGLAPLHHICYMA